MGKLIEWFGKTKLDEASEAWMMFKDIKRDDHEDVDKFILRFETAESNLRCSELEVPQEILAIQLINSINVDKAQKQNIVANVKYENNKSVYSDMKKSIKLLKGCLVEDKSKDADDDVMYGENKRSFHRRSASRERSTFQRKKQIQII